MNRASTAIDPMTAVRSGVASLPSYVGRNLWALVDLRCTHFKWDDASAAAVRLPREQSRPESPRD
jgi:hypothetical protein